VQHQFVDDEFNAYGLHVHTPIHGFEMGHPSLATRGASC
jgi:hypothetical protein